MKLIRCLTSLALDALENILFRFDFSAPADRLWREASAAEKRLVEREADEEVIDGPTLWNFAQGKRVHFPSGGGGSDSTWNFVTLDAKSSPARPGQSAQTPPAGETGLAAPHLPPSASSSQALQLTRGELLDAAHAARCYGFRCTTDTAAAKWHRLAHKLHHAK